MATTEDDPANLGGAGPALFRFVRFWSRRWPTRAVEQTPGEDRRVQHVVVLEAIDTAARGTPDVSVTDVAYQLGIDRSGASRLVTDAIEHGYLDRSASTADGRRAALTVTVAGQDLLTAAHAWQDEAYAKLTADWPAADAARLAAYLRRLADELSDVESPPQSNPTGT